MKGVMTIHSTFVWTLKTTYIFLLSLSLVLSTISLSPAEQYEFSVLPAPITSSELFPCSRCHNNKQSYKDNQRQKVHKIILAEGHSEKNYSCISCHDRDDFDQLRLFNGRKVDLANSSKLCGQCHSTNYKLWKTGLHGKVTGSWNGQKKITPCATCHDPHRPSYKSKKPEPPPVPPIETLRWNK